MQTHVPAAADQAKQASTRTPRQAAQLVGESSSQFLDRRPQMAQALQMQRMMDNSAQARQAQTMQRMVNASVRANSPSSSAAMMPLQRVADLLLPAQTEIEHPAQLAQQDAPKANNTGLPDQLKSGIESLSGMSMDHVKVSYNSEKPAQLNAHAYAQGSEIHVAPGQEQHLPHEAWHVVQQAQGRVQPTLQAKGGVLVNDNVGLEAEADTMGAKALAAGGG